MLKKILKFIGMLFGLLLILSGIGNVMLGGDYNVSMGIGFIIAGLVINYLYWFKS